MAGLGGRTRSSCRQPRQTSRPFEDWRGDMAETIPPITDFIDRWAREKPTVTAVSYGEHSWTWELWRERMLRNAAAQRAADPVLDVRNAKFPDRILVQCFFQIELPLDQS